jgi:hypothetical protein
MQYTNLYFDALLFCCCGYGAWRGAAPERAAAAILFVGVVLTHFAYSGWSSRWSSVENGVFAVDVMVLVSFIALALAAERFWILWMTALHLIGTMGHLVKLADPALIPWGYRFAIAATSYPMCLLIAFGTWKHRQRLSRFAGDRSWSNFSVPSVPAPVGRRTA